MKTLSLSQKGFTLIEFLLYMVLAVSMVLIIGTIGIGVLTSNAKGQSSEEIRYDAEFLLEKITLAIHEAESVSTPVVGATSTTLTLTMSNVAKNPTVIQSRDGKVYFTEGGGAEFLIAGEDSVIEELTFTNMSHAEAGNTVRIELTIHGVPTDVQGTVPSTQYFTTVHISYSI